MKRLQNCQASIWLYFITRMFQSNEKQTRKTNKGVECLITFFIEKRIVVSFLRLNLFYNLIICRLVRTLVKRDPANFTIILSRRNIYFVILSFSLHYKSHDWCREMPETGTEATRRKTKDSCLRFNYARGLSLLFNPWKNQVQLYRQKLRIINCYLTRRNLVMKYRRKLEKFLAYIVSCNVQQRIYSRFNKRLTNWNKKFGTKKKKKNVCFFGYYKYNI